MVAAVAVAASAAASIGGAMASSGAQSDAINNASGINQQNTAQNRGIINNATQSANSGLVPYAGAGQSALNQLSWEMGVPVPATPGVNAKNAVVPTTFIPGQTNDPLWEKILSDYQTAHQARFGVSFDRGWGADADAQVQYGKLKDMYLSQLPTTPDTPYVGQGQQGALMQNFGMDQYKNDPLYTDLSALKAFTPQDYQNDPLYTDMSALKAFTPEDYKNDPLYTPMVNSLEELQATPGYQFQLNQGLQSVNNSAASRGSLLSGGQLKAVNDYAQGQASTGYQAAWNRAQQAYQQAFSNHQTNRNNAVGAYEQAFGNHQTNRNNALGAYQQAYGNYTNNQNNAFNRLQSLANNGQTAVTNQGNNTMAGATALVGGNNNSANNQMGLAMAQGQNNANMYTGISNGINQGAGMAMTYGGNNSNVPLNQSYYGNYSNPMSQNSFGFNNGNGWA